MEVAAPVLAENPCPNPVIGWRSTNIPLQEARGPSCLFSGVYSVDSLQEVVNVGSHLAVSAGGLVLAARQLQVLYFIQVGYGRDFIERTQHLYTDISDIVMSIRTDGRAPRYASFPPMAVPGGLSPDNPKSAQLILDSIRRDSVEVKALVSDSQPIGAAERVADTPTTAVPYRLPDRA